MAALIGALRVSLSADTAQFQSGMKRAERQAKTSASSIQKSLGLVKAGFAGLASGLSIGLITQGIRAALDYAGSLGEVAQQLGVTTKDLQVFRYAAGQVGVSQAELETGLSKLTITLGKVAAGAKAPIAALNAIGISVDQIKGKDTGEAFRIIADGLQKVTDRSQRAAVEVALFGRSGAQLDTLLAGGSTALNELADAAERLGIVLSDEQIQKADETADKLDAIKTVLSAQIAGVVADNADAILTLANAFVTVAAAAGKAIGEVAAFFSFMAQNPLAALNPGVGFGAFIGGKLTGQKLGSSATVTLPPAANRAPTGGANIGQFLAGGGGGGKKRSARAPRDTSLRDAFEFEREQRRADIDILRAKQALAHDYVERTALSIRILDKEKEDYEAELQFRVASKDLVAAQAEKLRLKNDEVDHLNRMKVLEDEEEQRQRDYNSLEDKDFDIKMDLLEREAQLAETASERRAVELRILDLAYKEERKRLNRIIAESKDWAEIERARRDLLALSQKQSFDRQGVTNATRGPMEDYLASLPTTAAKAQEALEQLQVQGFEGLIDAAVALTEGFDSAKDALLNTIKQFLQGFLRMQLQQGLGSLLGSSGIGNLFGSLFGSTGSLPGFSGVASSNTAALNAIPLNIPGYALGGFTGSIGRNRIAGFVHGEEGVLNTRGLAALGVPNLNALNRGAPLTALVSNDNLGGRVTNQNFTVYANDADSFRRNERQIARDARRRLAI